MVMTEEQIEKEYREAVLKDPEGCPNLYEIEIKRNKWRFKQ